jgi:cyclopropane fatty-acyl-phospholipid synthase-like methyltransferase
MSNILKLVTNYVTNPLEIQIQQYRELSTRIKSLEAEREKLKKEMISAYFESHDTYKNNEGIILATYIPHERQSFKSVDFKNHHPDLFEKYSETREIKVLLIK